jgi:hypothetical protein
VAGPVVEDLSGLMQSDVRLGLLDGLRVRYAEKVYGCQPFSGFSDPVSWRGSSPHSRSRPARSHANWHGPTHRPHRRSAREEISLGTLPVASPILGLPAAPAPPEGGVRQGAAAPLSGVAAPVAYHS